jgi:hypothetical protein
MFISIESCRLNPIQIIGSSLLWEDRETPGVLSGN